MTSDKEMILFRKEYCVVRYEVGEKVEKEKQK